MSKVAILKVKIAAILFFLFSFFFSSVLPLLALAWFLGLKMSGFGLFPDVRLKNGYYLFSVGPFLKIESFWILYP